MYLEFYLNWVINTSHFPDVCDLEVSESMKSVYTNDIKAAAFPDNLVQFLLLTSLHPPFSPLKSFPTMQFASNSQEVMDPNLLRMLKSIRATIKTITTERSGLNQISQNHHLNGTFKQLCNKSVFAEMLFPGTSAEILENLPKNLKEILEWEELQLDLTKIAKSATEVLQNIKNKGKAQGDIMDEVTENVLLPQIGQEALSKGIIEAVRKLSRRVSQMSAKISQAVALPTAPQAQLDQLDEEVVSSLFGEVKVGVQREFLGEEWTPLIRNDIVRYMRNEKMSVLNPDGAVKVEGKGSSVVPAHLTRMCWIEPSKTLSENYAALAELITQVHALSFELNCKFLPLCDTVLVHCY